MHCTHTFPSTITPITQLSPFTHQPWLPHHTCTSFTHSHKSSTQTLTHCEVLFFCNDWSEASGFTCSKMFIEQRQKQTGKGQQAKQEYQRQSRDVNNTRQGSRSQAQVQSSKVGQSGVKHRDGRKNNAQNVSRGKTRLRSEWVFVCCFYVSEWMRCRCGEAIRVDEWMVTAVWLV